jgi:hypothetical protein
MCAWEDNEQLLLTPYVDRQSSIQKLPVLIKFFRPVSFGLNKVLEKVPDFDCISFTWQKLLIKSDHYAAQQR